MDLSELERIPEEIRSILLKLLLSEDWELITFEEVCDTPNGVLRFFLVKVRRGHMFVRTPDSYRMLSIEVDLGSGNYELTSNFDFKEDPEFAEKFKNVLSP